MTVIWFVLAALALIGAAVVMYFERAEPEPSPAVQDRSGWAGLRGLNHSASAYAAPAEWHRGAFEEYPGAEPADVAYGLLDGAQLRVFDLNVPGDGVSPGVVVALQRSGASSVVFDLRSEGSPAPTESDVHILGAIGRFFAFSNDLGVARRVCDRRMVTFAEAAPVGIETFWSEDDWAFAWLAPGSDPDDWDDAIAAVARFASLLRVLPPQQQSAQPWPVAHDPGGPRP